MATNPSTLPENSGRITAPDANYPYGSAQDDSTGTTGDGTPIKKALLNDTYGFYQWLLTQAGIVPSGNAETVLASDLGDALNVLFVKDFKLTVLVASNAAWTPQNETKAIEFTVIGGGGGGGGVDGQGSGTSAISGPGGSGATVIVGTSTVESSYNIVVGAGGNGGASGANPGSNGGDSSITSSNVNVTAGGGNGGQQLNGTAGSAFVPGGNGGTASGGDLNVNGEEGQLGRIWQGDITGCSSSGASSLGGSVPTENSGNGKNATVPGAGGGNTIVQDGTTNRAGGNGADGIVIIKEFF